jgi:hypothetical protein
MFHVFCHVNIFVVNLSVYTCRNSSSHRLSRTFKFAVRYIDDVISLNNSWFGINDITDTYKAGSCLYLHLEINIDGRFKTKLYDN